MNELQGLAYRTELSLTELKLQLVEKYGYTSEDFLNRVILTNGKVEEEVVALYNYQKGILIGLKASLQIVDEENAARDS